MTNDSNLNAIQKQFIDELKYVDDLSQIVIKGHLVMESIMTSALETYLLHGEFIEDARLSFSQKLTLCRSISTSDQNNPMWSLIAKINKLRNVLAHSLHPEKKQKALASLRQDVSREFPKFGTLDYGDMQKDSAMCMTAISGSLGFLHSFFSEIERLKGVLVSIDDIMNNGALKKGDRTKNA